MSTIKKFLDDKAEDFKSLGEDADLMIAYPMSFIDPDNGTLVSGYLQDVVETKKANRFTREMVVLNTQMNQFYKIRTECVAPTDCKEVDWDSVVCAHKVEY